MATNLKQIVTELNQFLANNDSDSFAGFLTDDAEWQMMGDFHHKGKQAIKDFLEPMKGASPMPININGYIEDGSSVASTGTMVMPDKDGKPVDYAFCDVYKFEGNKVRSITTYMVPTSK